jgi:hypothetical protein
VTVAALYVDPNGVYAGLPDVELWDEARDARLYAGPWPVVAHPPCKTWSLMGQCRPELVRGDDGGCFEAALNAVRTYGGVLEHPAHSLAWRRFALPRPHSLGWTSALELDELPNVPPGPTEWACEVDQAWYGHRANKRTWLLFVGENPPPLMWGKAPATGITVRNDGGGGRDQRSKTPSAFRDVLLDMARSAVRAAA